MHQASSALDGNDLTHADQLSCNPLDVHTTVCSSVRCTRV